MSAALDEFPVVALPVPRPPRLRLVPVSDEPGTRPSSLRPVAAPSAGGREATACDVRTLREPAPQRAAVRLTRRGRAVLGLAACGLGLLLVLAARLSAPAAASGSTARDTAPVAGTVVVHAGDTLWTIAGRVAPDTDPRAEIAVLQRLNRLQGAALVPGQLLRVS